MTPALEWDTLAKKVGWEEADLLLRLELLAAAPEMRAALDWYRRNFPGREGRPAEPIALSTPEYAHLMRLVDFGELVGLLVRRGALAEEIVHDRWLLSGPWSWLRLSIERERARFGPGFAENFEWLAVRNRAWSDRRRRSR